MEMEHVIVCVCPKSGNKSKDLQMLGTEPSQGFKQKNGFEQKKMATNTEWKETYIKRVYSRGITN